MTSIRDSGAHPPPVIGTQLDALAERCRELVAERDAARAQRDIALTALELVRGVAVSLAEDNGDLRRCYRKANEQARHLEEIAEEQRRQNDELVRVSSGAIDAARQLASRVRELEAGR